MTGFPDISTLQERLVAGETTAEALAASYLERVKRTDPDLGAFLYLNAEWSLQQAHESDKRRAAGLQTGLLEGIPIGIKDVLLIEGHPTTCGSRMLEGFIAPYTATAVRQLQNAGAVILGKLNNDEFAMGSSTENSAYQLTRNPWDRTRTPGGSSGGSAAAVAAGQVTASIGTDTGGSIRQPAAFCGVVGLKPTYGRVSRYGLVAFASSLDQVGPLTHSVADAAVMLQALAGHDPLDSTSAPREVPDYRQSLGKGIAGTTIGVPRQYHGEGLDGDVVRRFDDALALLRDLGATIRDVSLPHTEYAIATYYLIATAEASSNLARYDGVRYGHRQSADGQSVQAMVMRSRSRFGPEVKRRIMLGTYALSAGYYDAYYLKAQKGRALIRDDFVSAFAGCDLIATPTTPAPAFPLGELVDDPLRMYLGDIFTVTANLAGIPGISVPCGFGEGGLPIGLQFLAPAFEESRLFHVGDAYQRATDFHRRRPEELAP